jgi:hypothetical protein
MLDGVTASDKKVQSNKKETACHVLRRDAIVIVDDGVVVVVVVIFPRSLHLGHLVLSQVSILPFVCLFYRHRCGFYICVGLTILP